MPEPGRVVTTSPTVEGWKNEKRTVREPVSRRIIAGWKSRRRWNRRKRRLKWRGDTVMRDRRKNEQRVQWACQKRWPQTMRRSSKGSKSGGPQLWAQQRGKIGGGWGMPSGAQTELSDELAGGALKSMKMLRCSKEVARRGLDRTGTRSCEQKGHWSPQA